MSEGITCRYPFKWCISFIFIGMALGCGGDSQSSDPVGALKGRVTFQGKPVGRAEMTFHITSTNKGMRVSTVSTNEDGTYSIPNVPIGTAKVTIDNATSEGLPSFFPLPPKYKRPQTSGLTVTIESKDQVKDFELK